MRSRIAAPFLLVYDSFMAVPQTKYAIYPGTTPVYNEDGDYIGDDTFTAEELADLYGVGDEDYLVINEGEPEPQGMIYFEYIHLKPRSDRKYIDMKTQIEAVYRPDFDAKKRWTDETDQHKIDPEIEDDIPQLNQRIGEFQ